MVRKKLGNGELASQIGVSEETLLTALEGGSSLMPRHLLRLATALALPWRKLVIQRRCTDAPGVAFSVGAPGLASSALREKNQDTLRALSEVAPHGNWPVRTLPELKRPSCKSRRLPNKLIDELARTYAAFLKEPLPSPHSLKASQLVTWLEQCGACVTPYDPSAKEDSRNRGRGILAKVPYLCDSRPRSILVAYWPCLQPRPELRMRTLGELLGAAVSQTVLSEAETQRFSKAFAIAIGAAQALDDVSEPVTKALILDFSQPIAGHAWQPLAASSSLEDKSRNFRAYADIYVNVARHARMGALLDAIRAHSKACDFCDLQFIASACRVSWGTAYPLVLLFRKGPAEAPKEEALTVV